MNADDDASGERPFSRIGLDMPITGRLLSAVIIWLGASYVAIWLEWPAPGAFGIVVLGVICVALWAMSIRRRHRTMKKALRLQAELDVLKQKEFDLKYQIAEQEGAFKRFGPTDDR